MQRVQISEVVYSDTFSNILCYNNLIWIIREAIIPTIITTTIDQFHSEFIQY